MTTRDLSYLGLPAEITTRVELHPVEDIMLRVLRGALPASPIYSMIPFDQTRLGDYFILVRRLPGWGIWDGDDRFVDFAGVGVHVFTKDPNADEKAALISEAVRVAIRDAVRSNTYFPDLGALKKVRMDEEPVRRTDWATSSGPVQFADLPSGYQRYEARYSLWIRRPIWSEPSHSPEPVAPVGELP